MFTGIIEEIGVIKKIKKGSVSGTITVLAHKIMSDVNAGDSISVNGVCLTAVNVTHQGFTADVMAETLRRTSLGDLTEGSEVNLERAMPMNGRFGGHIVSGHIDGTGIISEFKREENAVWVTIETTPKILHYIIEKGSVAIDGISLTVAEVCDKKFKVSIIPHTNEETTLLKKKKGDKINLENDLIGKYVERFIANQYKSDECVKYNDTDKKKHFGMDTLMENGFI